MADRKQKLVEALAKLTTKLGVEKSNLYEELGEELRDAWSISEFDTTKNVKCIVVSEIERLIDELVSDKTDRFLMRLFFNVADIPKEVKGYNLGERLAWARDNPKPPERPAILSNQPSYDRRNEKLPDFAGDLLDPPKREDIAARVKERFGSQIPVPSQHVEESEAYPSLDTNEGKPAPTSPAPWWRRRPYIVTGSAIGSLVLVIPLAIYLMDTDSQYAPTVDVGAIQVPGDCFGGEIVLDKSIEEVNEIERSVVDQDYSYDERLERLGKADMAMIVDLAITAAPGTTVSITDIEVETDPSPPPQGLHLDHGCGDPETIYFALLNLDAERDYEVLDFGTPTGDEHPLGITQEDAFVEGTEERLNSAEMSQLELPFRVSGSESGHFRLYPITTECSCEWTLRVKWSAHGESGWITVDNDGEPFWTVSPAVLDRYVPNSGFFSGEVEDRWILREEESS